MYIHIYHIITYHIIAKYIKYHIIVDCDIVCYVVLRVPAPSAAPPRSVRRRSPYMCAHIYIYDYMYVCMYIYIYTHMYILHVIHPLQSPVPSPS